MATQRKYCSYKCSSSKRYYQLKKKEKRNCILCGKNFETCRDNQVFCSTMCRNAYHKTYQTKNKKCKLCKKTFVTTTNKKEYCGKECCIEAKHRRNKKNYEENKKHV